MTDQPQQSKEGNGGIALPLPWGGTVKATGAAAVLAVMIAGGAYWLYKETGRRDIQFEKIYQTLNENNKTRAAEFGKIYEALDRNACKSDLDIFVHMFPKGQIDWEGIPAGLYDCFPRFKVK